MSLRSPLAYCLPDETARVARAAFPRGNPYLQIYDALGSIFANPQFADLYPKEGQPAEDPARLALVTIFQFAEGLTDRQAADAVRARIDWKYALCLPLEDDGFDASVLVEFRARLLFGQAELRLFEIMLECLKEHGFVKARGRQRTDSTHVLGAIRVLNRLECVAETLRHALNVMAVAAPDWLRSWVPLDWFDRYSQRLQDYRLPKGKEERQILAEQIGADGCHLLTMLDDPHAPGGLKQVRALEVLRRVWIKQYYASERVPSGPRWRIAEDLPPASVMISSPYDAEARYSTKRETSWTGYRIHLTETCDDDSPNVITDVATTLAPRPDHEVTAAIQDRLADRDLLPREHLVDTGYMSADHLVTSRNDHRIDLLGPVGGDYSWQARQKTGYAIAQFSIDWQTQRATCPEGKISIIWKPTTDSQEHPVISIRFAPADCNPCPVRHLCVGHERPRVLMVRPQPQFEALMVARQLQRTDDFKARYNKRAGVEGTISQGVHVCDLRRTRYRGLGKTALGHAFIATALNFVRIAAWLAGVPRSATQCSAFAALAPAGP